MSDLLPKQRKLFAFQQNLTQVIESSRTDGFIGGFSSETDQEIGSDDEILDPFTIQGIEANLRQMRG